MTSELAEELRTTFLFERLTDEQLEWIASRGVTVSFDTGAQVYAEGDRATSFFVLLNGGVRLTRRVGRDEVVVTESEQRGVYAGATRAFVASAAREGYLNGMATTKPSRLFRLPADDFAAFMQRWFPMAVHLLEGLFLGVRNSEATVRQHEQLVALGSLSAGLAHELNNPAAAGLRAAGQLRERVAGMRHKLAMLADGRLDPEMLSQLVAVQEEAIERVAKAPRRSAMEESDAEEALADWLHDRGIIGAWELAPVFAGAGLDAGWLTEVAAQVEPALLEPCLRWLSYALETEALMAEVEDATGRISTLVAAVKQYSYMDRAPYQEVDVTQGLDSTVVLLGHKLGEVTVARDYAEGLPAVPAFGGELNQVWTNLIDNAVAAMDGRGTLTLRAVPDGDGVLVEVVDDGPGIPREVQPRVFEAFFTTKPAGEGSGLGLEIAHRAVVQRHGGRLDFTTRPRETRFRVWLPSRRQDVRR